MSNVYKDFLKTNLRKVVGNIVALFNAVDDDLTSLDTAVSSIGDDISDVRDVFLNGNVSILVVDDTLYDSNNQAILDSGENSVKASIIYVKQT